MSNTPAILNRPDGHHLAYHSYQGASDKPTTVIFLGGFASDMGGTKAIALDEWARAQSRSFVRFDYFGHGQSTGKFEEGTISRWADDALAIIDEVAKGDLLLIGSSMGGWVSLLSSLKRADRIKGLCLIAPAPDFTEKLMWKGFSEEIRNTIMTEGVYRQPTLYDEDPYTITRALIEDGRNNLLLDDPLGYDGPVRILQGMKDADVPWKHALKLVNALTSTDVRLNLIKEGDHRLSTEPDLALLLNTVETLLDQIEGKSA